jgi:hypothetical protein
MKPLLLAALCVLCAWSVPARASQADYDKEEAIRRAAQKVVQDDQYQRDAAKQRADAQEREARRGPPNDLPAYLFFGTVLVAVLVVVLIKGSQKPNDLIAEQARRERAIRAQSAASLDQVLAQRRTNRAKLHHQP